MRFARLSRWLLLGAASLLLFCSRGEKNAPVRRSLDPAKPGPSPLPLICAIACIVLAGGLWGAVTLWWQSREAYAVARVLTSGDPIRAPSIMTRYGCAGCHTIPDVPGADGKVGGSLAGLRQRVFIAGVVPNTADNLINWIVRPQAFSPRTAMPATGISQSEARDVAAWLYGQ
jgi:cytochrome c